MTLDPLYTLHQADEIVEHALGEIRAHSPKEYEQDREAFHHALLGDDLQRFPEIEVKPAILHWDLRPVVARVEELGINAVVWLFDDLQKMVCASVAQEMVREHAQRASEQTWTKAALKKRRHLRGPAQAEIEGQEGGDRLVLVPVTKDLQVSTDGPLPKNLEAIRTRVVPGWITLADTARRRARGRARGAATTPDFEARHIAIRLLTQELGLAPYGCATAAASSLLRFYVGEDHNQVTLRVWAHSRGLI